MKDKSRTQREKLISGIYKRLPNTDLSRCYYCDHPRQSLDHVPPLKYACDIDLDKFHENGHDLFLVPACNECNRILGSKPLFTIAERVMYLYEKYAANADKIQTLWDEEEIEELGRNVRLIVKARDNEVRRMINKAQKLEERLLSIEINGG